ncbi:mandelate racemase (plasmid) [Paroceanicella profunda]|uniref:Mandelate racemase n=1 Tax=Paroceanicella profunda TaxID=2579971 RepID=A0A5B8FJQ8_9RHOB|nr:enolase C-terminal domain-like protein [Paroceanicella profunda]QDL94638.1 mandelate racemase [Paroceanicella profunda]
MSAPVFRIRAVELAERPVTLRLPFRFGDTLVERTAEAYLRLRVEGPGGVHTGVAAQLMVPRWFDKRPERDNARTVDDLRRSLRTVAGLAPGLRGSVARLAAESRAASLSVLCAGADALPRLAAGFGPALLEMALIDAACRSGGAGFAATVRADALGLGPLAPPDLTPDGLSRHLAGLRPAPEIALRHTVGYDAPLTAREVRQRPDDLPVSLDEVVAATGVRWFKIKLKGDPEADIARLEAVAAVLAPLGRYGATLDANEQYLPEAFTEFSARLAAARTLAALREGLAFIEQPFARETALEHPAPPGLPALIDESDDADDAFPRAAARGYAGVSVKSCKGVLRALLNSARVAAAPGRAFLSAEDLTCQPGLCLQQDTAMAALVGARHVERNGHHFAGGFQGAPEAERAAALAAHPDLYRPGRRGPEPAISGGRLRLGSLGAPGFASAPGPDFTAMKNTIFQEETGS